MKNVAFFGVAALLAANAYSQEVAPVGPNAQDFFARTVQISLWNQELGSYEGNCKGYKIAENLVVADGYCVAHNLTVKFFEAPETTSLIVINAYQDSSGTFQFETVPPLAVRFHEEYFDAHATNPSINQPGDNNLVVLATASNLKGPYFSLPAADAAIAKDSELFMGHKIESGSISNVEFSKDFGNYFTFSFGASDPAFDCFNGAFAELLGPFAFQDGAYTLAGVLSGRSTLDGGKCVAMNLAKYTDWIGEAQQIDWLTLTALPAGWLPALSPLFSAP